MHLSFFTKMFGRSVQLSSNFGKTFSYVRDACWYKDNVYQADIFRKNNTCTSCVFNGFKYIIVFSFPIFFLFSFDFFLLLFLSFSVVLFFFDYFIRF